MQPLDYVLIVVISISFIAAIIFIIKQKKHGNSCCEKCNSCSSCSQCNKNK